MKVYVCNTSVKYEGEQTDGVYTSLAQVRKHNWSAGDGCWVYVYQINSRGVGKLVQQIRAGVLAKKGRQGGGE